MKLFFIQIILEVWSYLKAFVKKINRKKDSITENFIMYTVSLVKFIKNKVWSYLQAFKKERNGKSDHTRIRENVCRPTFYFVWFIVKKDFEDLIKLNIFIRAVFMYLSTQKDKNAQKFELIIPKT